MQRRHRVVHRWLWLFLAAAAVAALLFSLRARPRFESAPYSMEMR